MTDAEFLSTLPSQTFALMLILCRVGMVVMLLPGLGEIEAPATVRAGLALGLAVLLLPQLAPIMSKAPTDASAPRMIVAELLTGATLGWLARLPVMALEMAGAVSSILLGLSSVLQPDPALGGQSTALARLFGLVAPVLILTSGLYALPLDALVGSYHLVGPGGVLPSGDVADMMTTVTSKSLLFAVQLSAPLLLANIVWQIAVGLLARVSPQLQAFSIAAPGQILGGLVLLGLLASRLLASWQGDVFASWSSLPGS